MCGAELPCPGGGSATSTEAKAPPHTRPTSKLASPPPMTTAPAYQLRTGLWLGEPEPPVTSATPSCATQAPRPRGITPRGMACRASPCGVNPRFSPHVGSRSSIRSVRTSRWEKLHACRPCRGHLRGVDRSTREDSRTQGTTGARTVPDHPPIEQGPSVGSSKAEGRSGGLDDSGTRDPRHGVGGGPGTEPPPAQGRAQVDRLHRGFPSAVAHPSAHRSVSSRSGTPTGTGAVDCRPTVPSTGIPTGTDLGATG